VQNPRDLLVTFPTGPVTIWQISTRVNNPNNDDPSLLDPVAWHAGQSS
jgi:hypothetical protein